MLCVKESKKSTESILRLNICGKGESVMGFLIAINNDDETYINDLYVNFDIRGKGYAILMLKKLSEYKYCKNTITLNDHSSNYRQPHNIYSKIGFKYTSPLERPMKINLSTFKSFFD